MDKETKNTISVFDSLADLYQTKYQNISAYHQGLHLFCNNLKQKSKVLELACGPGNVTQYLIEQQPSIHVLCTDLAPNMLQLAQKANPSATINNWIVGRWPR